MIKKKKKIIIILVIIIVFSFLSFLEIYLYNVRLTKIKLDVEKKFYLDRKIEIEVYDSKKISDIFSNEDIEIVYENKINTQKLGTKKVKIKYKYKKYMFSKILNVNVVDNTQPIIIAKDSYTVYKGDTIDLTKHILSGDNYDNIPVRKIIGEYDLNKVGTYNLTYYIKDSSGNENEKDFVLKVIERKKNKGSSSTPSNNLVKFSDVISKYKNENTLVGIDVSKWQENIDFKKVKKAGCDFVIIRIGYQNGVGGKLYLDKYFKENIKKATEAGLKIGVYLYTYAKNEKEAADQAQWIIDNLGNNKVDFGISYDWESWNNFNELNLSFYSFKNVSDSFLNYLEKKGFKTMLYSSKYYLENIWGEVSHNVWLAHYASNTNYKGKYKMWQCMSNGKIDGIDGAVDIDIYYK